MQAQIIVCAMEVLVILIVICLNFILLLHLLAAMQMTIRITRTSIAHTMI